MKLDLDFVIAILKRVTNHNHDRQKDYVVFKKCDCGCKGVSGCALIFLRGGFDNKGVLIFLKVFKGLGLIE